MKYTILLAATFAAVTTAQTTRAFDTTTTDSSSSSQPTDQPSSTTTPADNYPAYSGAASSSASVSTWTFTQPTQQSGFVSTSSDWTAWSSSASASSASASTASPATSGAAWTGTSGGPDGMTYSTAESPFSFATGSGSSGVVSPSTTMLASYTTKSVGTSTSAVASAFTGGARRGQEVVVGLGVVGMGLAMVL